LKFVIFDRVSIGLEGAKCIAEAIICSYINELSLSGYNFDTIASMYLSEALKVITSLTILYLRYSNIDSDGGDIYQKHSNTTTSNIRFV
jgi:hypothetical protein